MMDFHSPVGASTSHKVWQKLALYKTFFLLFSKLLPVTFLLLSQSSYFTNILFKPNSWERCHHAVNIGGLSISTKSHNFSFPYVHLGLWQGHPNRSMPSPISHGPGGQLG